MTHSGKTQTLHLIGFGAQAQAWAQCLRASGWQTEIYLSRPQADGRSARIADELGFAAPHPLSALEQLEPDALVAFLCPDTVIGSVYREYLARLATPMTLILAHGYAVYANELKPAHPKHELALLAPKAIGPKIWALYQEAQGQTHRLVAGINGSSPLARGRITELARAMGFAKDNLVEATFEQEAVGDLLSEQGLLCGGVFTLLNWTIEAMVQAKVPAKLIREECLTELELIAGLLRSKGPESTFKTISQAAQCGTVLMKQSLEQSNARAHFDERLSQVVDGRFAEIFRSNAWKSEAENLAARLKHWEEEFK